MKMRCFFNKNPLLITPVLSSGRSAPKNTRKTARKPKISAKFEKKSDEKTCFFDFFQKRAKTQGARAPRALPHLRFEHLKDGRGGAALRARPSRGTTRVSIFVQKTFFAIVFDFARNFARAKTFFMKKQRKIDKIHKWSIQRNL